VISNISEISSGISGEVFLGSNTVPLKGEKE